MSGFSPFVVLYAKMNSNPGDGYLYILINTTIVFPLELWIVDV